MSLANSPARTVTSINYWPALLDGLTATFMVFVLSTYLQIALKIDNPEAMQVRRQQDELLANLQRDLARDLEVGNLEVERSLASIHLRFSDRVLFDSGQHELKDTGKELLDRLGAFLSEGATGVKRIQVEGHTDDVPFPAHKHDTYPSNNWQLSSARATEVTLYMTERPNGLPPELFSSNGYASYRPITVNWTESGRARNRRVELELVFATEVH